MRANALGLDLLGRLDRQAERVTVEGQRRRQIADGDANVIEDSLHRKHMILKHLADELKR